MNDRNMDKINLYDPRMRRLSLKFLHVETCSATVLSAHERSVVTIALSSTLSHRARTCANQLMPNRETLPEHRAIAESVA